MKTSLFISLLWIMIGIGAVSCDKDKEGKLLDASLMCNLTCKNTSLSGNLVPDTISRVDYQYNETTKTLKFTHANSGFNCCPEEIDCKVSLYKDTLKIEEFEKEASCDCNCLYDLNIDIQKIEKKIYYVQFIEPYAKKLDPIRFQMNLNEVSSGFYEAVRKQYPWGASVIYE